MTLTTTTKIPKVWAWWWAARPKTLTAALTPVLVGTSLAWQQQGYVSALLATLTVLMAILIQIGINFVNDALDYKNGGDTEERIGFARATQQGWLTFNQVMTGGWIAFALALACALLLASYSGAVVLAIALVCVVGGYLYSGGPYPLSHLGLSDPCVLIFFGLVATTTTVYIQTGSWPTEAFLAGTQLGLLATAISAINNLRDITQDAKAGRRTLPVCWGKMWARREIAAILLLPFMLGIAWWLKGLLWAALLPLASLPLSLRLIALIYRTPPSRAYNSFLAQAAALLLLFGILLSAGLLNIPSNTTFNS